MESNVKPSGTFVKPLLIASLLVGGLAANAWAGEEGKRRAKPPEWPRDVQKVFFDDARQALVGSRPDYAGAAKIAASQPSGASSSGDSAEADGAGYAWSELIDIDTLESEIKRTGKLLPPLLTTPSVFKGGGYRDCRDQFSWLAVLFALSADHDDQARWQSVADGLSQLYARAGFNCKVGTDQSFREAELRAQDLADLVRGDRPSVPPVREEKATWDQVADLSPLMRRMEQGIDERIAPQAADARSLKTNADDLRHEAQLLAVLAEIIGQEGFDYEEDETYLGYSHALRDASLKLSQATDREDFAAARQALGNMRKACSDCHDEYR